MRCHLCVALTLWVALAAVGLGGVFPNADILVANQLPDGSWGYPTWETGYMVPGLARAYELSNDPTYKASAELAGMWVLNNAPLIPVGSVNPYNLLPFPDGSYPNNTTHQLLGEEAYAFRRLSEINASPSGNLWRSEITNFYGDVKALYPGSTLGYVTALRTAQIDASFATDMLAHHVMAAGYVGATDLGIWRTALVNSLAMVTNASAFPVLALGSAVWALASTLGGLDGTVVDPTATLGSAWWDYINNDGPATLLDLPAMLASHQELTPGADFYGTFYWRFDHLAPPGQPAYGYTEDTVFGALGLQASALYGYGPYDTQVNAAIYALLGGFAYWDNYMREHVGFSAYAGYNFMYAAEGLRLAIPEPCSMALLAGGCAALILRRRRRLAGKVSD